MAQLRVSRSQAEGCLSLLASQVLLEASVATFKDCILFVEEHQQLRKQFALR